MKPLRGLVQCFDVLAIRSAERIALADQQTAIAFERYLKSDPRRPVARRHSMRRRPIFVRSSCRALA